jgi:hypothetical protein
MASLMKEMLTEADFNRRERFAQMVLEEKARMEQAVVPSGHMLVNTRLNGQLSLTGRISEELGGVQSMFFVRDLVQRVEQDWSSVWEDLCALHHCIVRQEAVTVDLTADESLLAKGKQAILSLLQELPSVPLSDKDRGEYTILSNLPGAEWLIVSAQVNYVGLGMNMKNTGWKYTGALAVIMRHLRMGYLWDRVRVQGGAYGCFARYSRTTGAFTFASYRDPNVADTLSVYRGTADYLGNLSLSDADITRAVVGAIGDMDTYMLPGAKGATSFSRWMSGETDEERQRIRDEILSTKLSDFHDFAPYLAIAMKDSIPCVLGGSDAESLADSEAWKKTKLL